MDTVRFGRVLGLGARHAAKTLITAVDAATAPHPDASRPSPAPAAPPPATPQILPPAAATKPPAPNVRRADAHARDIPGPPSAAGNRRGLAEGSRRFGQAVWRPAVRLSGVLWLELTGTFFGLFALVAAIAVWRLRGAALHPARVAAADPHGRTSLLFAAGMMLLFGYFCVSSFLAARRRSRGR